MAIAQTLQAIPRPSRFQLALGAAAGGLFYFGHRKAAYGALAGAAALYALSAYQEIQRRREVKAAANDQMAAENSATDQIKEKMKPVLSSLQNIGAPQKAAPTKVAKA